MNFYLTNNIQIGRTTSISIAKATIMRNGLKAARASFTNIFMEGDNKIFIEIVQGCIQTLWKIQVLLQDSFTNVQLSNHVSIAYIFS